MYKVRGHQDPEYKLQYKQRPIFIPSKLIIVSTVCLDVLPSKVLRRNVQTNSHSLEAKAVIHIASGNSRILQRGKHLPAVGSWGSLAANMTSGHGRVSRGRAGHEARGTLTGVAPGTEGLAGSVLEGTLRRARGDVTRVGSGEAQGTIAVDVDALTTRDDDILIVLLDGSTFLDSRLVEK